MQLFGRQFKPSLLMTVLYLLIGGAMLGLGAWQMQRANEKIAMQEAAAHAATQPPLPMAQLDIDSAKALYARVALEECRCAYQIKG